MIRETFYSRFRPRCEYDADIPLGEGLVELACYLGANHERYRLCAIFAPKRTTLCLRSKIERQNVQFAGSPAEMEPLIRFAGAIILVLGVSWEDNSVPGTVRFLSDHEEFCNLPNKIDVELLSRAMFLAFTEMNVREMSAAAMTMTYETFESLLRVFGSAKELATYCDGKKTTPSPNMIFA